MLKPIVKQAGDTLSLSPKEEQVVHIIRPFRFNSNYMVGTDGSLYNLKLGKFMQPTVDMSKRRHSRISAIVEGVSSNQSTHRVVAMEYLGLPDDWQNLQVNHINMNQYDPRVANLEWCTPMYNSHHSVAFRGVSSTEGIPVGLEEDAIKVCEMLSNGKTIHEIHTELGFTSSSIQRIKSKETWTHISDRYEYAPPNVLAETLDESTVRAICVELSKQIYTSKEIAKMFGVATHQVKGIRLGTRFSKISKEYNLKRYDSKLMSPETVKMIYLKDKEIGHTITKKALAELCGVHVKAIDRVRNGTTEYVSEILKDKDNW